MSLNRYKLVKPFFKLFPHIKLDFNEKNKNKNTNVLNFKNMNTSLRHNFLSRTRPSLKYFSKTYSQFLKRNIRVKT